MARMLERRRTPRHQLGRVAAILCGPGAERSCLVKDFSDGGVRLPFGPRAICRVTYRCGAETTLVTDAEKNEYIVLSCRARP